MAQAGTNPKIEELRFKVKTDPKSRLFYPLAEELRKVGQFGEAEQVLRAGLSTHATYLSAWVVLGRVLREQQKYRDAVDALSRALELDRGNVVVARLLAEVYLELGEKVEALKKYKLVHALLPGEDDIEAMIHQLERELSPSSAAVALAPPPEIEREAPAISPEPFAIESQPPPSASNQDDVFDNTYSRLKREAEEESATGDAEPMSAAHDESPFEESAAGPGYSTDAFEVEQPPGMHIAPMEPEPETEFDQEDFGSGDGVAPGFITGSFGANVPPPPAEAEDFARTITMADLYANQGLIDEARDIFEDLLARDPDNETVRAKLEALDQAGGADQASGAESQASPDDADPWAEQPSPQAQGLTPEAPSPEVSPADSAKVRKLAGWLSKVKRTGVDGV